MTVEAGDKEKGAGRCVLVGLRIDGDGRELLNWALGKVAEKGDHIVAVHVSRSHETSGNPTLSLIEVLNQYLSVYEGFCNLKQVVLVGRVSCGTSARKVLVREAAVCRAGTVVVGVGKNLSLGGSTSLAKFCAKKLPPTTALIALQNGKIVFKRGATKMPQGGKPKPILHSLLHPSIMPIRRTMSDIVNPRLSDVSSGESLNGEVTKNCNLLVYRRTTSDDPGSISALVRKLPDTPGWPLLQRALSAHCEASQDTKARKMSVVQWAMTLPNRTSPLIQSHTDRDSSAVEFSKVLERIIKDNSSSCRWLWYEKLQSSTNQFSSEALIGKGGSSQVYKGCLPSGEQVAVKLSKLSKVASSDDFLLEIDILTTLRHDHVVPLKGICVEDDHIISVYNYFSRGSLEENLHGKRANPSMTWDKRFKVAIGIADALSYLHSCSRPVIHRDVKSSNILLSEEFEPQLSDFNLALWAPTTSSYLTHTDVLGTFGYLAPEYFMYGRVSDKIDVYAFGVVLLELLSGRKPISDENPKGQESLVMWAKPILERGDIAQLLDPNLDREIIDEEQMSRMALAASLCLTTASSLRPRMSQTLSILRGEEDVEVWMNSRNLSTLNDQDDEAYPASSIRSHLGLAFQDVDDDSSVTSSEQNNPCSLEDYLQGRWSRSSSFD